MPTQKQTQKIYANAIAQISIIGPIRFKRLANFFPDFKSAWQTSKIELLRAGIDPKPAEVFLTKRRQINPQEEWAKLKNYGLRLLLKADKEYPARLKQIYDAPEVLYIKGQIKPEDDLCVAVVGTRKISSYGRQITPELSQILADNKITVVSGLALGTDTLAHRGALQSPKGRTIAVLGGGLDEASIYPSQNKTLSREIIERGAVLSEFPIGTTPLKFNFPRRNRIVAGMSLGVTIIEAPLKSGALITARNALEYDREVFAVPGSVFSANSLGPNNLIKQGAIPVTSGTDILEQLNIQNIISQSDQEPILADNPIEAKVLNLLNHEPIHIDLIIKNTNLTPREINSTLTLMELRGKVKNLGGMRYVLAH